MRSDRRSAVACARRARDRTAPGAARPPPHRSRRPLVTSQAAHAQPRRARGRDAGTGGGLGALRPGERELEQRPLLTRRRCAQPGSPARSPSPHGTIRPGSRFQWTLACPRGAAFPSEPRCQAKRPSSAAPVRAPDEPRCRVPSRADERLRAPGCRLRFSALIVNRDPGSRLLCGSPLAGQGWKRRACDVISRLGGHDRRTAERQDSSAATPMNRMSRSRGHSCPAAGQPTSPVLTSLATQTRGARRDRRGSSEPSRFHAAAHRWAMYSSESPPPGSPSDGTRQISRSAPECPRR